MENTDATDDCIQLYPAWRQALANFRQAQFPSGSLLTHDWLYENFGLVKPEPTTPLAEAGRLQLAFLSQFKTFEEALLVEHQVALQSVPGEGYRLVLSREQSRWAVREGEKDIKRAIRKMGARTSHVNLAQLTATQRQENADALVRVASLRAMLTGRGLPTTPKKIADV